MPFGCFFLARVEIRVIEKDYIKAPDNATGTYTAVLVKQAIISDFPGQTEAATARRSASTESYVNSSNFSFHRFLFSTWYFIFDAGMNSCVQSLPAVYMM